MTIEPGKPIRFDRPDDTVAGGSRPTAAHDALGKTLKAYREAAVRLLAEKYPALTDIAPLHMRGECDCLVVLCDDGILVRWQIRANEKPKVTILTLEIEPNTVANVVPTLSDGFVYCTDAPETFEIPRTAPTIQFAKTTADGAVIPIGAERLAIVLSADQLRAEVPPSLRRPVPLVSVVNEFTFELHGEEFDAAADMDKDSGQKFVAVNRTKLALGWEAFEVYPRPDGSAWSPESAPDWAEVDLLAIAARRHVVDQTLHALDPRSAARKQFAALLKAFEDLLEGAEAAVQAFLEEHPELLRPTYARVWKRLPIGDHITDFVIEEATGEYLLVEIEAPIRPLFRKDGQPRQELVHAVNQVSDWIEYLQRNLETVMQQKGLRGISANPRALVVIGRSRDLTEDNRRKINTLRGMVPRLDIVTYDELLSAARATLQNVLGTLPDVRTTGDVYYIPGL